MSDDDAGGRLVVVATPIGNLGDVSPRAAEALLHADVVAAEDTRRSRRLLQRLVERSVEPAAVVPELVSYHEHNEEARTTPLIDRVAGGEVVALVSDAGTPGVADPGYRLVAEAVARGVPVVAVPGPSAVVQALVLSGLPTDRFAFEGFVPRKPGARAQRLVAAADDPRTLVWFVAPHRARAELEAMAQAFGGGRRAALARELTKLHEEVWHGTLDELAARAAEGVRGEVTVVVAGAPDEVAPDEGELLGRVAVLRRAGRSRRDAVAQVAAEAGVARRALYQASLDADG